MYGLCAIVECIHVNTPASTLLAFSGNIALHRDEGGHGHAWASTVEGVEAIASDHLLFHYSQTQRNISTRHWKTSALQYS